MSDESVLVSSPAAEEGAAAADVSAGTLLRQAREASGLHVAALAVAMKVPVRKLEALEADRLDDLPDAVFVRALAASVCRTLKIDASPILSRLPQSVAPKLDSHERGLNTPVRMQRVVVVPSLKGVLAKPSVLLVGVILLAVLAVLFVPEIHLSPAPSPAAPVATDVPAAPPVPVANDSAAVPAAPAQPVAAPPVEPSPTTPVAPAAQAPAAAPVAVAAAPVASPASANAAPASGLLVFKTSAASWVRVTDSTGVVVFEKTLQSGESAAANGSVPLSVVVGNVAGTEVLLRGKPFQMVDLNQNNVARFEVK